MNNDILPKHITLDEIEITEFFLDVGPNYILNCIFQK